MTELDEILSGRLLRNDGQGRFEDVTWDSGIVAGRGLLFLDDGSSARSRVMNFASNSAPVLKADLVLDGDTAPAAIDARLDQLVAIAEQRGYAIATATAFPSTVDRVAAFAKTAEDRGIALVPISAIVRPDGT